MISVPFIAGADVQYFDQHGNKISESEYRSNARTWHHDVRQMREKESYARYRRLMMEQRKRERVEIVGDEESPDTAVAREVTQPEMVTSVLPEQSLTDEGIIPRDSKGRPLKDSQGRWITYPDAAKKRKSQDNKVIFVIPRRRSVGFIPFGW